MSRKYKFANPEGVYFVSFATVQWIDVFTRRCYKDILVESINYCVENKGLKIYAWVIMSNHVHLLIQKTEELVENEEAQVANLRQRRANLRQRRVNT